MSLAGQHIMKKKLCSNVEKS